MIALTLTLAPEHAAAHGLPPAAVAIVSQDAQGPRIVRLTAGLALRQTDGAYRFLCPASWGDADSLPAYALPDQPALVLSSTGLWLLHDDGSVTRHPDPRAEGYAFDLAAQGGKLFVLRSFEKTGSEIIQVAGAQITSIWRDAALWTSLTAGTDFLAVARLTDDDRLAQQKLTPDGRSLSSAEGKAPAGTVNVLARGAGPELYLAIAYNGGRQLGQLGANGWQLLHTASAAIAGPVQHESGSVYLALDGSLARLQDGALAPLEAASDTSVTCLGCYERQCYACTRDGVLTLDSAGLGAASFELSKLVPPTLTGLDLEAAASCDLQWQHLRFDLLALGESLRDGEAGAVAANSGDASAAHGGAGGAQGISGSGAAGNAPKPAAHGGGCNTAPRGRTTGLGALALVALVLGGGLRRRRR